MQNDCKPEHYLDRVGVDRQRDNYLFISYSHADAECGVYRTLNALQACGVRFWYDKGLVAGDKWDAKVGRVLTDPNCIGVLFFLSPNAALSEAVGQEIALTKERQKQDPQFWFSIVSVNGNSVNEYVRDAYCRLKDADAKTLSEKLPQERVSKILDFFTGNIIFVPIEEDIAKTTESLTAGIAAHAANAMTYKRAALAGLQNASGLRVVDNEMFAEFGKYPQTFASTETGLKSGVAERNGKRYLTDTKGSFEFTRIVWEVLEIGDDSVLLVSERYLEYCAGGGTLERFLKEFPMTAFSERERAVLRGGARVPLLEELKKYPAKLRKAECSEYARLRRMVDYQWIGREDGYAAAKNGSDTVMNFPAMTVLGVRIVVEADARLLTEFLTEEER